MPASVSDEQAAMFYVNPGTALALVREWCRLGRIRASKKAHTCGAHPEWLIGRDELQRIRSEGLLPVPKLS